MKSIDPKEVAISVNHITKYFEPSSGQGTVKSILTNLFNSTKLPNAKGYLAVEDVNIQVMKGEFFGIVGRNGSGKSTLLKIIAGVYTPTEGSIEINGRIVPFIELGVGFNPELTGRDNVFLNGAMLGFSRKEMTELYDEIVSFAELDEHMDVKLKNFSSGMQVRLAFSIAIRAKSEILLIDEVLAVGDAAFQRKCFQFFRDIKKDGRTVILVTHDMGVIQQYCDRAMMIQDSKVLIVGTPREVALQYEVSNLDQSESSSTTEEKASKKTRKPDIEISDITLETKREGVLGLTESLAVKVTVTAKNDIKHPVQLNTFITQSDGSYIAGINTTGDLGKIMVNKGKSVFGCKFAPGQIPRGEYRVGAGVYTYEEPAMLYDIIDPSRSKLSPRIRVVEKSSSQDGAFYISAKWQKL